MAKGTTSLNSSKSTRASTSRRRLKNAQSLPASTFPQPSKTELDALRLRLIDLMMHEDPELTPVLAAANVDNQLLTIGLTEVWEMLQRMPQISLALLKPGEKGK